MKFLDKFCIVTLTRASRCASVLLSLLMNFFFYINNQNKYTTFVIFIRESSFYVYHINTTHEIYKKNKKKIKNHKTAAYSPKRPKKKTSFEI